MLLDYSEQEFLFPRFQEVSKIIDEHKDSKDLMVKQTALSLLPMIAAHHNTNAARGTLSFILATLRAASSTILEPVCFVALGKLASVSLCIFFRLFVCMAKH